MFKRFIVLGVLLFTTINFYGQISYGEDANTQEDSLLETANFVENYEIRRLYRRAIDEFNFNDIDKEEQIYNQSTSNHLVKVSILQKENSFVILFSNETSNSSIDRFSMHTKGNVAIEKKIESGSVNYMRIFLQDDGLSYIEIKPNGANDSLISVVVNKVYLYHDIGIKLNFYMLFISPVTRIMKLTNNMIDWSLVIPNSNQEYPTLIKNFTSEIRSKLEVLASRDTEDGAMDYNKEFLYIESGKKQLKNEGGFNCSGFVKWLADAFYAPINDGKLMNIKDLKILSPTRKSSSINQLFPDRDPYFGLDWVRNIAITLAKDKNPNRRIDFDSTDVKKNQFFSYIPDVGYSINNLKTLLYILALQSPNKFYLGSINKDFGTNPVLRQHFHTVALFPYFNEEGEFIVEVYERNSQTSVKHLEDFYRGSYIHLSSIDIDKTFELPSLD